MRDSIRESRPRLAEALLQLHAGAGKASLSVIVKNPDGSIEEVGFDYGCICMGMKSNNPVLDELFKAYDDGTVEVIAISDSKRARRIIEGTEEGRNIIRVLEKRGFID